MSLILVVDDSPTILRVVELVLAKHGYEVVTALDGEAGLEAARRRLPDLILLDFIMPKLNGYQFCRELAADPQLQHTPVVLMSAKGEQVGARFVRVLGIVDYVSKPFAPEALLAVIDRAMDKFRKPIDQTTKPLLPDDFHAAERRREEAVAAVSPALRAALASPPGPSGDDSLKAALAAMPLAATGAVLAADLHALPLMHLLRLVGEQAQTGNLVITGPGGRQAEITIERGFVQAAFGRGLGDDFALEAILRQTGVLSPEEAGRLLAESNDSAALPLGMRESQLGEMLLSSGVLKAADLQAALAKQTSEVIYEALRWTTGEARLFPLSPIELAARSNNHRIDVEGLLMEGYRRLGEWHVIAPVIESLDAVFVKNEDAANKFSPHRLSHDEQMALELLDGRHTLKDIIAKTRLGSLELQQVVCRLLAMHVIRRRVPPVVAR